MFDLILTASEMIIFKDLSLKNQRYRGSKRPKQKCLNIDWKDKKGEEYEKFQKRDMV